MDARCDIGMWPTVSSICQVVKLKGVKLYKLDDVALSSAPRISYEITE